MITKREATIIEKERIYRARVNRTKADGFEKRFYNPDDRELSKEEKQEFSNFWSKYLFMYNPDIRTCKICTNRSGNFDVRYIPFGLIRGPIREVLDKTDYATVLCDKNYFDKLVTEFKQPKTIIRRIGGFYSNSEYELLTENNAVNAVCAYLKKHPECVIKPTLYGKTSKGKGVEFFNTSHSNADIRSKLRFSNDFIIQEVIQQHKVFADINPSAVLTIRVTSLAYKNEIHIMASTLRMGGDARVDNFSQGGLICKIDKDGKCGDFAYDLSGKLYETHPNGSKFSGVQIPRYNEVIEKIKKTHAVIPQLWCIGWDITINSQGEPIFFEYNPRPGFRVHQLLGVPIFGDLTEEILDHVLDKYYIDRSNKDYDYYEFHDHIRITGYAGGKGKIIIPSEIDGKSVTEVGYKAFHKNSTVENITLPKSIRKVGLFAFSGCSNLKSLCLPNELKRIPKKMCVGSKSLERVTIPDSVSKISLSAFEGIDNVVFDCSKTSYAAEFAKANGIKLLIASQ